MVRKPVPPISEWKIPHHISLLINPNPSEVKLNTPYALDVEDDENNGFVGLGIYDGNKCYYWSDASLAKQIPFVPFIAHNGSSDIIKMQKWGCLVTEAHLFWDTMLYEHTKDSSYGTGSYGLKALALKQLGIEYPAYDAIVGSKACKVRVTLDKQPVELVANYNARGDCYATYELYQKQTRKGYSRPENHDEIVKFVDEVAKPLSFVFRAMEERGVKLDLDHMTALEKVLSEERTSIENRLYAVLGTINLNSPKQLLEALIAKGIKPKFKGKVCTDKRALAAYKNIPVVKDLLDYSVVSTLLDSFVYSYQKRGTEVVHPHFEQTGTRTGRPSCSNPNLLQIPRRTESGKLVRKQFVARPGKMFADFDYGQIDPRFLAHFSKDRNMCKMFHDGINFHTFTMERLGIEKDPAKTLNLSVGYRTQAKNVARQLGCSEEEAQAEIDKWWNLFPDLHDWEEEELFNCKRLGYVETVAGRRIKITGFDAPEAWMRAHAENQAINNKIQGSAADLMNISMIQVAKQGINILVQVYDELLIEEEEDIIKEKADITENIMRNTVKLNVPLVVDRGIGYNWNDAKH